MQMAHLDPLKFSYAAQFAVDAKPRISIDPQTQRDRLSLDFAAVQVFSAETSHHAVFPAHRFADLRRLAGIAPFERGRTSDPPAVTNLVLHVIESERLSDKIQSANTRFGISRLQRGDRHYRIPARARDRPPNAPMRNRSPKRRRDAHNLDDQRPVGVYRPFTAGASPTPPREPSSKPVGRIGVGPFFRLNIIALDLTRRVVFIDLRFPTPIAVAGPRIGDADKQFANHPPCPTRNERAATGSPKAPSAQGEISSYHKPIEGAKHRSVAEMPGKETPTR